MISIVINNYVQWCSYLPWWWFPKLSFACQSFSACSTWSKKVTVESPQQREERLLKQVHLQTCKDEEVTSGGVKQLDRKYLALCQADRKTVSNLWKCPSKCPRLLTPIASFPGAWKVWEEHLVAIHHLSITGFSWKPQWCSTASLVPRTFFTTPEKSLCGKRWSGNKTAYFLPKLLYLYTCGSSLNSYIHSHVPIQSNPTHMLGSTLILRHVSAWKQIRNQQKPIVNTSLLSITMPWIGRGWRPNCLLCWSWLLQIPCGIFVSCVEDELPES